MPSLEELRRFATTHPMSSARFKGPFAYPFRDAKDSSKDVELSVASFARIRNDANGNEHLVVIACKRESNATHWYAWCGDACLEGRNRKADAAALAGRHKGWPVAPFGSETKSDRCHFWAKHAKGQVCKHVEHAMDWFTDADARELSDALDHVSDTAAPAATSFWGHNCSLALQKLAFRVPVLLEGESGSGKTTLARSLGDETGAAYVELAGHEGIEAIDVLGYPVQSEHGLIWKDGALSQAFRLARSQKVIFAIDELLRIPRRQLSVLLSATSPHGGQYRLRTGRIVAVKGGVGQEEVLECPVENLAFVATTNVGAQYALDEIDPALADRWVALRCDNDRERMQALLAEACTERGFDVGLATSMLTFYDKASDLLKQRQLNRKPSTRTLMRAVSLADTGEQVPDCLRLQALTWIDRDASGYPIDEQRELINDAIEASFSI
jgi:MoxR-like ATPase